MFTCILTLASKVDHESAVKRAKDAGIVVAAFDVAAAGADITVMTDNVKAGTISCGRRINSTR